MRAFVFVVVVCLASVACGGDDHSATPTDQPTSSVVTQTLRESDTASPTLTTATSRTPIPNPFTAAASPNEPSGFPIDAETDLGVVIGTLRSRSLVFGGSGKFASDYAWYDFQSEDPETANRSGWNCETHYEYEGAPAVDFYIETGTPIISTLNGTATLNIISVNNDFDRYGVDREPYLGNPDRTRAPYSPFPGPSSGLGVYVRVENAEFATEYGHMDVAGAVQAVPANGFVNGYSASSDYATLFSAVPSPRTMATIARWDVHRGDVIGASGDSGYSEGPHIHYTVNRTGGPLRCPSLEPDFTDGGWLFKPPPLY